MPRLLLGDSAALLRELPDASVDSVVTDPPAGIGFMGVGWDAFAGRKGDRGHDASIRFDRVGGNHHPIDGFDRVRRQREGARFREALTPVFADCLRVLRPGHYALVWALPRTSHWTTSALEDAGFEIRDVITHLQGQGFPKAKSCLKPASEHWILCRRRDAHMRPLNIDGCRAPGTVPQVTQGVNRNGSGYRDAVARQVSSPHAAGRWPANVVLSHAPECVEVGTRRVRTGTAVNRNRRGTMPRQVFNAMQVPPPEDGGYADADGREPVPLYACVPGCPVRELDEQSGERRGMGFELLRRGSVSGKGLGYGGGRAQEPVAIGYGDTGGASRFFPCFFVPKASRSDRNAGGVENHHPTVKPLALMRWLCRLVTPPGGVVLDPFMGSGTTGIAAVQEGFGFIGMEREPDYFRIAEARIAAAQPRQATLFMAVGSVS